MIVRKNFETLYTLKHFLNIKKKAELPKTIHVSSIVRRVLTRELRGECGAGGFSPGRGA